MKTAKTGGFMRPVLLWLGGLIALLVVTALVLSLVRLRIDLSGYKGAAEATASAALGRKVRIDGEIIVTTSLWPYFEIQGMRIANPDDFEAGDLAHMNLARITVSLPALMERKLHVKQFQVDGLTLNLVTDSNGAVNWVLAGPDEVNNAASPPEDPVDTDQAQALSSGALAVDKLLFEDIAVTFRNDIDGEGLAFELEQVKGSAPFGEPMKLSMNGALRDEPFTLDINANSLGEFLAMTRSQIDIEAEIAETNFQFSGLSDSSGDNRAINLKMSVEGKNLNSLDDLLQLDLPPLADYRLGATLTAVPGRLELTDFEATVKNSTLSGSLIIDRTGTKPFATMTLTADTIQLTDFDTGDWSPDEAETEADEKSATTTDKPAGKRAKLLSPQALQRANIKLDVRVADILSGEDKLGNGELKLEIKDGRISLDPLRLKLPKASLLLHASVKPGIEASDASLRALIKDFDFGALARLSNPDSDIGGTLNMDIDVSASARNIRNLMTGANGYFDLAGRPENFHADVVDLWAVNLLSSVVSSSVEDESASQINCIISRWSLDDGIMSAQNLAVDTSKIRICGTGDIDFNDNSFDLTIAPTAKRPEFFSLATPLAVKGKFRDFRIGMDSGVLSLGTTAVKFAISPITTPFKRLIMDDLPADGSDICSLPIGPHEGELEELPGC
jgi:uncharacterized protein involved in outer membrane biogenesis